jgi:hypothetical protein
MRWAEVPAAARWAGLFVALGGASAGLGALLRVGAGNGIFLAGVGTLLVSLTFIRLGGPKTLVGRDIKGKPIWGLDNDKRSKEIRRGWFVFSLAMALWGVLLVAFWLGVTL